MHFLVFSCFFHLASTTSSVEPLSWNQNVQQTHNLIPAKNNSPSLDAVLASDCLLLRNKKSEQKAQIVQANFLLDLSDVGRQSENIRSGIRQLRHAQPVMHTDFQTCATCSFEYIQLQRVNYFDCSTLCHVEKATMIDNLQKLEEIFQLQQDLGGHAFKKVWIRTEQKSKSDSRYLVNYNITVPYGNRWVSVFPVNTYNWHPNVCYDHVDGKVAKISACRSLGADVRYWQTRLGTSSGKYYTKTHLKLLLRAVPAPQYFIWKQNKKINSTVSLVQFQQKHLHFEVVLPRSRVAAVQDTEKASCFCHRPVSHLKEGLSSKHHHKLVQLETEARGMQLGLERERLKKGGLASLSNIDHLLQSTLPPPTLMSNVSPDDVFPLQISASLPTATNSSTWDNLMKSMGKNHHLLDRIFLSSAQNKRRRAIPSLVASAAISGLFKTGVELGAPYLLSKSEQVFSDLIQNKNGIFLQPSHLDTNTLSAQQMQAYLEVNTNAAIRFQMRTDRVQIHFLDFPKLNFPNNTNFTSGEFQRLDSAIARMEYFEKQILPSLPSLLLQRLWPLIYNSVSQHPKIFVQIQKAKSFVLLSYYYERVDVGAHVTSYHFYPLPCQQTSKELFTVDISNVSVEVGRGLQRESVKSDAFQCQTLFMAEKVSSVTPDCSLVPIAITPVQQGLRVQDGFLFLFHKCVKVYIACQGMPANTITLTRTFHVLLIGDSCAISATFRTGLVWSRASVSSTSSHLQHLHILAYDPIWLRTPFQRNEIFISVLASVLFLLLLGVSAVILAILYLRRRYAISITVPRDEPQPQLSPETDMNGLQSTETAVISSSDTTGSPPSNRLPSQATKTIIDLALDNTQLPQNCSLCKLQNEERLSRYPFYGTSPFSQSNIFENQVGKPYSYPLKRRRSFLKRSTSTDSALSVQSSQSTTYQQIQFDFPKTKLENQSDSVCTNDSMIMPKQMSTFKMSSLIQPRQCFKPANH